MMAIINASANNNSSSKSGGQAVKCSVPSSSSSNASSMEDDNMICPLCMENLDIDDRSFYPCTCGYQICRFCWHRIRSESDDQNGLCPACRKQYSENPATFKPLTSEDIQKLKLQKRQKDQQKKQKSENGKRHLADLRVVQKNLVFVVGISPRIADPDVLKKNEFFGKFGKIHKVVVNPCLQGSTASAYITYIKPDDALRAIQSVNNIPFDGKTIKVSLGTTKYCSHFMRNQTCPKSECMYLHHYGDPEASFTKEDMQAGKHQEYEKKLLDEFNTHQNNNNNNEERGQGESKVNGVKEKHGKRIANGSSIQQGVSYSTKLLVNNAPAAPQKKPSSPPSVGAQKPQQIPERPPQPPSTTPPCSSSASSTSSADHNLQTATSLLENTTLSEEEEVDEREEEEDDEEEEYHEAISSSEAAPEETAPESEAFEGEFGNGSTLDLDFDPFHETQKAFEEIINEQVGGPEVPEQSSLLRRFIKPQHHDSQSDFLLGFHHAQSPQQQQHPPQVEHRSSPPHQQQQHPHFGHLPSTTQSSLLLDFFNNYAYKQVQQSSPAAIPPPPGFHSTQPSQSAQQQPQSSSVLLEKLNRTLLGNNPGSNGSHWGGDLDEARVISNTAADWMSLDPAIIFSKTSTERNAELRNNAARNFIDNPLHGIFGDRVQGLGGNVGLHHHLAERERFLQSQSAAFGGGHPLIRPTPTSTTPPSNYGYANGLVQQQQQQQQSFYGSQRPAQSYFGAQPQQQQGPPLQSRYYSTQSQTPGQQQSVVTPPPPGFPLHSGVPSQSQGVYALQQMHAGGSGTSSGFFPF